MVCIGCLVGCFGDMDLPKPWTKITKEQNRNTQKIAWMALNTQPPKGIISTVRKIKSITKSVNFSPSQTCRSTYLKTYFFGTSRMPTICAPIETTHTTPIDTQTGNSSKTRSPSLDFLNSPGIRMRLGYKTWIREIIYNMRMDASIRCSILREGPITTYFSLNIKTLISELFRFPPSFEPLSCSFQSSLYRLCTWNTTKLSKKVHS